MGVRPTEPFAVFDTAQPPRWFDAAAVLGPRTVGEIADLRAELERQLLASQAVGARWRAVVATVEQCVAATLDRAHATGSSARGHDAVFAAWTRTASGLDQLDELGARIAAELDVSGTDDAGPVEPELPLMVEGHSGA
jgi:hypothetical protein